jgi:prevent-host-death family protein
MNLSKDIKSIDYLSNHSNELINNINENKRAIIITQNNEAKAVIQDIETYENLQNSLNLLKLIIQSEKDIEKNNLISQEELFTNLENKLFN